MSDLLSSADKRFSTLFSCVANAPNQLQFANAQYAAFGLKNWTKQLWSVPSG